MPPEAARPLPSPIQPLFIVPALLSRHQGGLIEGVGGRRLLRDERQLQVTDDPVDDRRLGQEGHNSHLPAAARTDQGVHLVDRQEPVEVMEQDPKEDGALRMSRTVDSRHIGKADSRSVPKIP
jgi:hypothetical protein